jgi:hypothetical protein
LLATNFNNFKIEYQSKPPGSGVPVDGKYAGSKRPSR